MTDSKTNSNQNDNETAQNVRRILQPTTSPRPLHPKVILKRELQINDRSPSDHSNSVETSTHEPVYMLSQLLKDLDQLCAEQEPYVQKKLEEISIELSNTPEQDVVEDEIETEDYGGNLLRGIEFSKSLQKKEEPEAPPVEEDSEDEINDDENSL